MGNPSNNWRNMIRYKVLRDRSSCYACGDFRLEYLKGTTVKAIPGTLGIMVFDTYENADVFATYKHHIVKVKPIGRGKKRPSICTWTGTIDLNYFYEDKNKGIHSPPGTICYPAVEVLE